MHLHEKCSVPYELMSCEYYFTINGNRFRSDLVVFGREGYPLLAAECKAPQIKMTAKYSGRYSPTTINYRLNTFCSQTVQAPFVQNIPEGKTITIFRLHTSI